MASSPSDSAGPLLGWSLASFGESRRIHDLVQFPCEFCFKAVGRSTAGFVANMLERVSKVLGRAVTDDEHSTRKSAQGKYESVTLRLWVESGDQVYAVYEALSADERVKFLL
jgi:putative lipoic acid-binding regulatory protein